MSTTMQVLVVSGDIVQQETYIENFKSSEKITPYLVTRFDDGFKILDARNLQKTLSVKIHNEESRLIIIKSPTLDSQNALLKMLEELPQRTFMIFLVNNKEELLPTVLSRALCVDLGAQKKEENHSLTKVFLSDNFHKSGLKEVLEVLSPAPTDEDIEACIMSLRSALFKSLENGEQSQVLLHVLKNTAHYYSFSKSNNINKRMTQEVALISRILPIDK